MRLGIAVTMFRTLVNCVVVIQLLCCLTEVQAAGLGCGKTARAFQNYRLVAYNIPQNDISGEHLQICAGDRTCCTEGMELQLSDFSKQQLDGAVSQTVQQVADDLGTQGNHFDDFFRSLMNESRTSLDAMFKKTYGVLYERNAHVFTDLFKELELYYSTGVRDLSDVMHDFFTVLYKRMFTVLNSQHTFDEKYLQCVATHMEGLKPFRDVPAKLTQQLKRSFVATRTLVQSLRTGHDVVKRLQTVNVTPSCGSALMKMSQCATCGGMPRLKACHGFCLNVVKGCLAHHSRLNDQWHQYIEGITDLVSRLEGPFNIESVVSPINVKISYAIMNFQDNGYDVSRKIFEGCGDPKFRRRRQAGGDAPSYDATSDFQQVKFDMYPEGDDAEPSPLLRVLGSIRARVRPLKTFWYDMPSYLCNERDLAAPPARIMNCWNGTAKDRYEQPLVKDGMEAQVGNPEVPVDPLYTDSDVNEAILELKRATIRLRDAYNGQAVTWEQPQPEAEADAPPLFDVAGSGSGDGDGARFDVDAETGDDDADYDFAEGSGDGGRYDEPEYPSSPDGEVETPRGGADIDHNVDNDRGNDLGNSIDFQPAPGGEVENAVPDAQRPSSGGAPRPRMSLARAVTVFVCPTVVAWIGTFI